MKAWPCILCFFLFTPKAFAHGRPFEVNSIQNNPDWIVARTTRGLLLVDRTTNLQPMTWVFRCGEGIVFDVASENPAFALTPQHLFLGTYDGLINMPLAMNNTSPACTSRLVYTERVVTEVAGYNGTMYFMTATFGGSHELYRMDDTPTRVFEFQTGQYPVGLQVSQDGFWTAWTESDSDVSIGHVMFQPWDISVPASDIQISLRDNIEQSVKLIPNSPTPFVLAERNALEVSSERLLDSQGQMLLESKNILDVAGTLVTTSEGVFQVGAGAERISERVYASVTCDVLVTDRCEPIFGNSMGIFNSQHEPVFLFSEMSSLQLGARDCSPDSDMQMKCEARVKDNRTDLGLPAETKGGCGCRTGASRFKYSYIFFMFLFFLHKKLSVRILH